MFKIEKIIFCALFLSLAANAQTSLMINPDNDQFYDFLQSKVVLDGSAVEKDSIASQSTVRIEIKKKLNRFSVCTGVIISPQYILTAGHCLDENNARVKIQFGLGGDEGFESLRATSYRSMVDGVYYSDSSTNEDSPTVPSNQASIRIQQKSQEEFWKDGFLTFDAQKNAAFNADIAQLTQLRSKPESYDSIRDFALIKIEQLPNGFSPIPFYSGTLLLNKEALAAGYGVNSRLEEYGDDRLRSSKQKVIGYVARSGKEREEAIGVEIYSEERRSICLGDSGGPTFVYSESRGQWELLGINVSVFNNCADSSLVLMPSAALISAILRSWAREMNAQLDI